MVNTDRKRILYQSQRRTFLSADGQKKQKNTDRNNREKCWRSAPVIVQAGNRSIPTLYNQEGLILDTAHASVLMLSFSWKLNCAYEKSLKEQLLAWRLLINLGYEHKFGHFSSLLALKIQNLNGLLGLWAVSKWSKCSTHPLIYRRLLWFISTRRQITGLISVQFDRPRR